MYKRSMWTIAKFFFAGVVCYLMVAVWLFFSQKRLLFFPRTEHVASPNDIGLEYEDVNLTNRLGTKIHGWWLPNENGRLVILFAHGNGGNVSHRLETFRILHDMGHSTFMYDYSGYGQSQGEPSEQGMYADARAAWDWLVEERHIPSQQIILFGRSLGGAVTARLANELKQEGVRPAGIVLESTFSSVPDMGAYMYPWLPVRQLASYSFNSVEAMSEIDLPALFAHSEEDEVVPYAIGRRLYESYSGSKSFMPLIGDHNTGYLTMDAAYPEGLSRFLDGLGD